MAARPAVRSRLGDTQLPGLASRPPPAKGAVALRFVGRALLFFALGTLLEHCIFGVPFETVEA